MHEVLCKNVINGTTISGYVDVIDYDNKIVTTPCYMLDARISGISEGIDKLIQQLIKLADGA